MCATAWLLTASTPAPDLQTILSTHTHALQILGVRPPKTVTVSGTIEGLGLHGSFQSWRDGDNERYDETLGIRTQRTLRLGDVEYVQNANGDVRVLRGLIARRQITEDFVESGEFARHPEHVQLLGAGTLPDGRAVWNLRVSPPGGEPYGIALDTTTGLIDQKSFVDGDSVSTSAYYDYRVSDGALYPTKEVDSDGDRAYDITSTTQSVRAGGSIDPALFAPLVSTTIDASAPVVVPLLDDSDHFFVRGSVDGKPLIFLVDSGAQGLFLDPAAAKRLNLTTEGTLEVNGMRRTSGRGVAALDAIEIGAARLPAGVVSVIDLSSVTYHGATVDGVLGYPLFAAAEVRIDPQHLTLTLGKPGSLPTRGAAVAVDTDRELPELTARIANVDGRFLVDTGNTQDLIVFHEFATAHPAAIIYAGGRHFASNRGVGGSSAALRGFVGELDLGPYRLFNRYTDVMLTSTGAFADRNDAGNIGLGSLRNFMFTFDLANRTLFLEKGAWFDDGRYRTVQEQ